MKSIFTLLGLFFTLHVFGQADFTKYESLVKDFAQFGAIPNAMQPHNARASGIDVTHKLDSIVNKNAVSNTTDRLVMQYNENGTTNRIDEYTLDSGNGQLRLNSVYTFSYSGLEQPSSLFIEAYNEDTQQFEDAIGIELIYDDLERVDSSIISIPDPLSGDFGPVLALKYVYDGDFLVQSRQWFFISLFGFWVPASFTDFQYDVQDRLAEQQTSIVDFATMEVSLDSKITYAYNAEGLTDLVTDYIFLDPNWLPTQQYLMDYYSNETVANEFLQFFDGTDFINQSWSTYPVEDVVDQYPSVNYSWDFVSNSWTIVDSVTNLLNPALHWNQVAAPSELSVIAVLGDINADVTYFGDGPTTDEIHYSIADSLTQVLFPAGKDYYYYSLIEGAAVAVVLPKFLSVNPNPAQDQFTISIDQNIIADYVVYASNGVEKVSGKVNPGSNNVRTSSWPQGIYYVIITLEDGHRYAHKQLVQ